MIAMRYEKFVDQIIGIKYKGNLVSMFNALKSPSSATTLYYDNNLGIPIN